jgi:hypothetical protein
LWKPVVKQPLTGTAQAVLLALQLFSPQDVMVVLRKAVGLVTHVLQQAQGGGVAVQA